MRDKQPKVFVIDDDPSIREALEALFRSVGLPARTFASTQEFLNNVLPGAPGCLVLDLRMPGLSGLDFQRDLNSRHVEIPIIFVTGHGDIPMSVRAMKAGAIEFLTKPFRDQDLLDAIHVGLEKDRLQRRKAAALGVLRGRFASLTSREQQVMALVVTGRLNKQIAGELAVTEVTIKVHRSQVMQKMEAGSLAELVRMADAIGLGSAKEYAG
jgi:FixJ family two-component response regulator